MSTVAVRTMVKPVSFAAVVFHCDQETQTRVRSVRDVKVALSGRADQYLTPRNKVDFDPDSTYYAKWSCPTHCQEQHEHDYRAVSIMELGDAEDMRHLGLLAELGEALHRLSAGVMVPARTAPRKLLAEVPKRGSVVMRRRGARPDARGRVAAFIELALASENDKGESFEGQRLDRGQLLSNGHIYLGLGRQVPSNVYAVKYAQRDSLYLNFLVSCYWTDDTLSVSCLDSSKLKTRHFEGRIITDLPAEEVQLVHCLYNDFLVDRYPHLDRRTRAQLLQDVSGVITERCRDSRRRGF